MISKITNVISRTIPLAVCAVLATATYGQVPTNQKPAVVDTSEIVAEVGSTNDDEGARGTELSAATIEEVKTQTPGRFTTASAKVVPSKNPFAIDITDKASRPAAQTSGSEWQFAFSPYLYMTGIEGTIGARGRTAEIDLSFGDVISNFKIGIMGTFEARKNRFVFVSDLMWIKLDKERDTPGSLFSSSQLGVNMFIFDPEAGYRIYEGQAGSFDVLGGVRIMSVETNLNFRPGILPGFDVSERKTWATPVIGAHGTLNLSPKLYLATKFDIGGGLGADFTGQFYGGAGYRITPKIALVGGYRYLNTDYDSESGFVYDANMNGIVLGAKFQF